jgi:hypothetical protein
MITTTNPVNRRKLIDAESRCESATSHKRDAKSVFNRGPPGIIAARQPTVSSCA